jgi:hypothetical protein
VLWAAHFETGYLSLVDDAGNRIVPAGPTREAFPAPDSGE